MLTHFRRALAAVGGSFPCGKRRAVAAEAVGGVSGVPGLAGVREWRGWRGCGREAFIGRSKLLLLL